MQMFTLFEIVNPLHHLFFQLIVAFLLFDFVFVFSVNLEVHLQCANTGEAPVNVHSLSSQTGIS
jgi:hypothetical protein